MDLDPKKTTPRETSGSGSEPSAILLEDIRLTLSSDAGAVDILRGIDLDIRAGETVGVVGPSGSGKTSMLMVIAGLEKPTSGRITTGGSDITHMGENDLALFRRDHVGVVFQDFHLAPTMTALENAALPLEFAGRTDAHDRARAALEAVGLDHRLTHYPGQLSGGEQQRVAMARAFVTEPAVLLADEPTGNLDGATGEAVMDLLFELQAQLGNTLFLITHEPVVAERCSRILHLADGLISADEFSSPDSGPSL